VLAVVTTAVVVAGLARPSGPSALPLTPRQVSGYVRAADDLVSQYVEQSWCRPMLAGTVGAVPRWPAHLATVGAAAGFEVGPPRGVLTTASGHRLLDMSDVRSVLPAGGRAWRLTPGFCVYQAAYPRLVTSGGRSTPSYAPLPHRLRSLDQIFDRFPKYLGMVTQVAVPVTVEVTFALSVNDGAARRFHLSWVTTVAMVPTGPRGSLRISNWALDASGAYVTVQHDDPPGPVVVRSSPPGSGP
jgi:hypothetical protein